MEGNPNRSRMGARQAHIAAGSLAIVLIALTVWFVWPRPREWEPAHEPMTATAGHSTVRMRFDKLAAAYYDDVRKWLAALPSARTDAEREAIPRVNNESYAQKMWDVVEPAADDPAALEIYTLLIAHFWGSQEAKSAYQRLERHLNDPNLAPHCRMLATCSAPEMESFLRKAHQHHTDENARLHAGMALAHHLRWQVLDRHARLNTVGQNNTLQHLGTEQELRVIDEVEAICHKAEEDHADKPCLTEDDEGNPVPSTMGKVAKALLDSMESIDIRRLAAGQPAPEIDAIDSTGRPLKLSSLRGKVVLISFGGKYCVPCKAMIPHERDLLTKMKDRPFALFGLDRSESSDLAQLQAFLKREGVTWPVCPGRSNSGQDLFRTWKVHAIPVFYLIDELGRIRRRIDGYTEPKVLNEAVEELVKEAEARRKQL